MDPTALSERARAVLQATVGKTAEVSMEILQEFTERLPELPFVESSSYTVDIESDPPDVSVTIVFTGGKTIHHQLLKATDMGGTAPQFA